MIQDLTSWAERTYRRIQRAERLFCVFWDRDKDRPFAVPATEAHVLRTRGEVQFDLATIGYYDSRCLPEWIEEDVRDFARSH